MVSMGITEKIIVVLFIGLYVFIGFLFWAIYTGGQREAACESGTWCAWKRDCYSQNGTVVHLGRSASTVCYERGTNHILFAY